MRPLICLARQRRCIVRVLPPPTLVPTAETPFLLRALSCQLLRGHIPLTDTGSDWQIDETADFMLRFTETPSAHDTGYFLTIRSRVCLIQSIVRRSESSFAENNSVTAYDVDRDAIVTSLEQVPAADIRGILRSSRWDYVEPLSRAYLRAIACRTAWTSSQAEWRDIKDVCYLLSHRLRSFRLDDVHDEKLAAAAQTLLDAARWLAEQKAASQREAEMQPLAVEAANLIAEGMRRCPSHIAAEIGLLMARGGLCSPPLIARKCLAALREVTSIKNGILYLPARHLELFRECAMLLDPDENVPDDAVHLMALGRDFTFVATARVTQNSPGFAVALLALGEVDKCLEVLRQVICSRKDWLTFDSFLLSALTDCCREAGRSLNPDTIRQVLVMCNSFSTTGLLMGRFAETVCAGVGEAIAASVCQKVDVSTKPRDVVGPFKRALCEIISHINLDFNRDVALSLIDSAARAPRRIAVPLLAALVHAMESSTSLCMTSNGCSDVSFRIYAANAVTIFAAELADHVTVLWPVDVNQHGSSRHTSGYWSCKKCGRPNSTRYAFCSCSALRWGWRKCHDCRHEQDERIDACLVCGSTTSWGTPRVLTSWRCDSCQASNTPFHAHQCHRCSGRNPNGALGDAAVCEVCGGSQTNPTYCSTCGNKSEQYTSDAANFVWYCGGCGNFHAGCELLCPIRGNFELTPHTSRRRWESVECKACGHVEESAFAVACGKCEADLRSANCVIPVQQELLNSTSCGLMCTSCFTVNVGAFATQSCAHCRRNLGDAEYVELPRRRCGSCGRVSAAGAESLDIVCRHCTGVMLVTQTDVESHCEEEKKEALQQIRMTADTQHQQLRTLGWERGMEVWSFAHTMTSLRALKQVFPGTDFQRREAILRCVAAGHGSTNLASDEDRRALFQSSLAPIIASLHSILSREREAAPLAAVPLATGGMTPPVLQHRRLSALLNSILNLAPEGDACRHCSGTHPEVCCEFADSSAMSWVCEGCSNVNRRSDDRLARYLCLQCLAPRDEVQVRTPTEVWRCDGCKTLNIDFESFCISCGATDPKARETSSGRLPFSPSRCEACGLVFLEATCPSCEASDALMHVRAAEGVVTCISERHAVITPSLCPSRGVFVSESLMRLSGLKLIGQRVTFSCATTADGKGLKATFVKGK